MNKRIGCILLSLICFLGVASSGLAHEKRKQDLNVVVFATFGTTVPRALPGILNIRDRIQKRFPKTKVKVAFTSNIIRRIWHKRQHDETFKKANPSVSHDIFYVKGPLATIADLQDQGFTTIVVQPGHITLGEELLDLASYIRGLNSIHTIKKKNQPFKKLVLGRPALGSMGPRHPYLDDIKEVARALAGDVKAADAEGAALVYMGHGNKYFPSSGAYLQLIDVMHSLYPGTRTYLATVEGFPSLETIMQQMKNDQVEKVLLKPLMNVAGDHARNDMAGDGPDSMKSILERNGFQVTVVVQGLGEKDAFADVYVDHLAQTAADSGISLK